MSIPTIRVKTDAIDNPDGYYLINESDFDSKVHVRFSGKPPQSQHAVADGGTSPPVPAKKRGRPFTKKPAADTAPPPAPPPPSEPSAMIGQAQDIL